MWVNKIVHKPLNFYLNFRWNIKDCAMSNVWTNYVRIRKNDCLYEKSVNVTNTNFNNRFFRDNGRIGLVIYNLISGDEQ